MGSDEYSEKVSDFYNASYKDLGFNAQRKYPNEELCRFMGRNFFHLPQKQRKTVKILETGCGSAANLWMIAKEEFEAYGVDLSPEAITLAKTMLDKYNVTANLSVQDMSCLTFPENYFDAVVDVFSSYCLPKEQHALYLKGIKKILKPGGLFFSYFPAKTSDTYQFPGDAPFIDADTLACISREDSPFYGQNYPFRFIHSQEYKKQLISLGMTVNYLETINKTYRSQAENFGFVTIEAQKNS